MMMVGGQWPQFTRAALCCSCPLLRHCPTPDWRRPAGMGMRRLRSTTTTTPKPPQHRSVTWCEGPWMRVRAWPGEAPDHTTSQRACCGGREMGGKACASRLLAWLGKHPTDTESPAHGDCGGGYGNHPDRTGSPELPASIKKKDGKDPKEEILKDDR